MAQQKNNMVNAIKTIRTMTNNNLVKDCTTCANLHVVDRKYKACIMDTYFSYLIDYPLNTPGCAGWKPKKRTE